MKKKLTLIFLLLIYTGCILNAQVGIGTILPNAALDIESTNDGLLIPRIALSATNVVTVITPTTSEIVYNTFTSAVGPNQVTPGFYFWNGTLWVRLITGSNNDWTLTGNAGTVAGTNFLGTTDAIDLRFRTNNTDRLNIESAGNVGIGTNSASNRLHIVNNADGEGVLRVDNNAAGGFTGLYFFQGASYKGHIGQVNTGGASGFGGKGYYQLASGDRPMIFSTNSGSETYFERVIIAQNGYVGINTNPTNATTTIQPTSTLQVNGSFGIKTATIGSTSTLADDVCKVFLSNGASNITITLPNPSTCAGRMISFTRWGSSSGTVTLTPSGGNIQDLNGTIVASTTIGIHSASGGGVNIQFWSSGSTWYR